MAGHHRWVQPPDPKFIHWAALYAVSGVNTSPCTRDKGPLYRRFWQNVGRYLHQFQVLQSTEQAR